MDPTDQNTQEQEQPISPALRKRLLEQEDDTEAYYLGLFPQEYYDTFKRIKTHDFLATFDQPRRETVVISSDTESESESDVSNRIVARTLPLFPTKPQGEYRKNIARRYAASIHNASENKNNDAVNNVADKINDNDDVEDEVDDDDDSPTPFSEAIKAIQERAERNKKKEIVEEPPLWIPKQNGKDSVRRRSYVPSLQELSLRILAKHSDAIVSLDCVCDKLRHRLSNLLCDSRKMNCHFLELLLTGVPTQIRLKDCSWLTEEEFTKYFGNLVTSEIEVCSLSLIVSYINMFLSFFPIGIRVYTFIYRIGTAT